MARAWRQKSPQAADFRQFQGYRFAMPVTLIIWINNWIY